MNTGDRAPSPWGSPPAPGTLVAGKYRVDGVLGEGGMGVVLLATHVHLREKVAIKLLHASRLTRPGAVERFMREARAASRIRGEHVVRVFDVGLLDDETPYLVMEHLEGLDLSAHLAARGPLPAEEAADYVLQACEALAEAHAHAIVHRDLKPANLFLTRRPDGTSCLKVLDFGVSKTPELLAATPDADAWPDARVASLVAAETLDGPPRPDSSPPHVEVRARPGELTGSGATIGSPRYMAPEQMVSARDVDARADVWSLGAVLFELVTGRAAFGADSVEGVVRDVMAARFTSLRGLVPDAPAALESVIARCLAVDPNDRYDGVRSLARALAPLASARGKQAAERVARIGQLGPAADGGPAAERERPGGGARRTAARVAALLAVAGVVAAAVPLATRSRAPAAPLGGASSSPEAPGTPADRPSVTGAPVLLPQGGECAELPVFASDGSLVSLASQGQRQWIERLVGGDPAPRTLLACAGACWYPAPGGDGRVGFAQVGDATSMGLEVRSISLDGTDGRLEAARGRSSWRAGPSLFFVREDHHAILRHAEGGGDETVFEAESARTFRALTASPDGRTLAVTRSGLESRLFTEVCFGAATAGAPLDCASAGESSSQRPAFGPDGRVLYFARGTSLVRFDPARKTEQTVELAVRPTSLALSGDRLVASTCEPGLELVRWADGKLAPMPPIERSANELALGPHGELAYPVRIGDDAQLVVADASGEHPRVLTSGARRVTEAAFSPDGRRVAFQDVSAQSPGIFVLDAVGARSPLRLTTEGGDCEIAWLDDERLLYLHPSPGYAFGRLEVVSANGGTPAPFWNGDGIFQGVRRARHTILIVDWRAEGTRFFERAVEGGQRELVFAGAPRDMKTSFSGVSVSGRYLTWIGGGGAWIGDIETLRATRIPVGPMQPLAVYADDDGHAVVAARVRRGGLYEIRGSFP